MPFHNLFGGHDSEINDRIVRQAVQRKKGGRVSEKKDGGASLRRVPARTPKAPEY